MGKRYEVFKYENNEFLPGKPSTALCQASLSTDVGVVPAIYSKKTKQWELVTANDYDRSFITTVYVVER